MILFFIFHFSFFIQSNHLLKIYLKLYIHIIRAALGKYRAALNDLIIAERHDPSNKAVKSELLKTKELLRQAVSRAPMVSVDINGMIDEGDGDGDGDSSLDPIQGPELPF